MKRLSTAVLLLVMGALAGSFFIAPLIHGKDRDRKDSSTSIATVPKELTSYRAVVKKVLPCVVSIDARSKPKPTAKNNSPKDPKTPKLPFDEKQIPEEFREFLKELQKRRSMTPDQMPMRGFGSGFIVDAKGIVLTNFHVVNGADEVVVRLMDGSRYLSRDICGDRKTDLAIVRLKTKGKSLPVLELGDSDAMEIGDRVLALGAPFGLTGSVTSGIVSAKGRSGMNLNMYEDFIQTDAAINPGNSGGPLVNLEGKVIGINTAIKSRSGGFQGIGLAVPSNQVAHILRALVKDGVVKRGYLGVQIKDLNDDLAQKFGVAGKQGVVVGKMYQNSPAAKAGLQTADVILSINGKPIKDGKSLQNIVAMSPIDKAVPMKIVRDGQTMTLKVTIELQPDAFGTKDEPKTKPKKEEPTTADAENVGLEFVDLSDELAQELGYPKNRKGAMIVQVQPNSLASLAGLRKGMLLVKVESKPVASAAAAKAALKKGSLSKGILVQVEIPDGTTDFVVLKTESDK